MDLGEQTSSAPAPQPRLQFISSHQIQGFACRATTKGPPPTIPISRAPAPGLHTNRNADDLPLGNHIPHGRDSDEGFKRRVQDEPRKAWMNPGRGAGDPWFPERNPMLPSFNLPCGRSSSHHHPSPKS
ncbi:hypothetical protein CORC01_05430 [Colletotrichum orchidophilum]|uniref:Uncharacterized protein n=1 Tax=Colletotrichum orchidophilum TaxID=1209926 RepID=A0A1G4BD82_9PEZI|nr:uncharacterized protein CORC01_05430 [Colletotrichum orchidophilum]OHE99389.1 hypothetical protein CORC01_05430 [Colletotrichum orchidophilum]